jgi:hypothetical protein
MKPLFIKTLPLWLCLFFLTSQGQMSAPRPQYRSVPSDSSYKEYENPPKDNKKGETVTIIEKKKLMPDGSYQKEPLHASGNKNPNHAVADSSRTADQTPIDTAVVAQAPDTSTAAAPVQATSDTPMASGGNIYLLYGAISLLGLAVLLALLLLLIGGRDKKRPPYISLLQAVFATAGLVLLLAYVVCLSGYIAAVIVLLLAALSGAVVLANDVNERPNPTWLVGSHIVLAIAGIVMLCVAAFMH